MLVYRNNHPMTSINDKSKWIEQISNVVTYSSGVLALHFTSVKLHRHVSIASAGHFQLISVQSQLAEACLIVCYLACVFSLILGNTMAVKQSDKFLLITVNPEYVWRLRTRLYVDR